MFYAQLNEFGICIGVQVSEMPIDSSALVQIPSFDDDYIKRKYVDGVWSDIKYDIMTNLPADALEGLRKRADVLEADNAELWYVIMTGGIADVV